jgi:hypothetical protein
MQPNIQPHQPLPTSAKRVFFPVTRFIGDTNEKNQVIADRHGNPVSGNFTVAIHEQVKEAAPLVASITEKTDEEEPTPKSTKTARKANGKSGSKKAKQEGQGSDQVTAEEVAA